MNRTTIEEKLKEVDELILIATETKNEKMLNNYSGQKSAFTEVLALLHSEDGEVSNKSILDTAEVIHDYMRNGDKSTSREECLTWIAQLIQEASQYSPIVKDEVKGCKLIAHATGEGWHLAVSNEDGDEIELDFDFVVPKRFHGYITTSQLKSLGFEIV